MNIILWTATFFLLHGAHSYILLTANIEDLQNIARRLVQSPIAGQVGGIMRRAYSVFSDQLSKVKSGYESDIVLGFSPDEQQDMDYRRNDDKLNATTHADQKTESKENENSSLEKSSSVYLKKIEKSLETA